MSGEPAKPTRRPSAAEPPATIRAIGTLSRLSPWLGAQAARHIFLTPRAYAPKDWERESISRAEHVMMPGGLHALRWGIGGMAGQVLCIHGWEGRASQFGPLAEHLAQRGFVVTSLEGPGHGSNRPEKTHMMQFTRALLRVQPAIGPLHAVIGHSMGGVAAAVAAREGLAASRLVLIGAASSVERILSDFTQLLGLSDKSRQKFFRAMHETVGLSARELDLTLAASPVPALLVHAPDDVEVPFADAERLAAAWKNSTLITVPGAGHRRILRSEIAWRAIDEFLAAEPLARAERSPED